MNDWQEETKRHVREAGERLEDSALDYFAWAKDNKADAALSALFYFLLGGAAMAAVLL